MNCTFLNTQIPYDVNIKNIKINNIPENINKNYKTVNITNKKQNKEMNKQYQNCKQGYVYEDPRTTNNVLMTSIPLDRPCDKGIDLKDIYKIKYPSLKNGCTNVSEFNIGNIQYYNDPNNNVTISNQSLIGKSTILYCEDITPMGVTEKSKTIISDTLHKNNLSDYQYHRDELTRREDMMLNVLNKVRKNDYDTITISKK